MQAATQRLASRLRSARHVLFITGAGMSAEAGLSTYRGKGGLYEDTGMTDDGVPIEEALSGPMMEHAPDVTWKHLWAIGGQTAGAKPSAAHAALTRIQQLRLQDDPTKLTSIGTQNIDRLHQRAGTERVWELHGNVFDVYCTQCRTSVLGTVGPCDPDDAALPAWARYQEMPPGGLPPKCATCGGVMRPNVVLFGESLPQQTLHAFHNATPRPDCVVSVGTTAVFPYVLEPMHDCAYRDGYTADINPERGHASMAAADHIAMRAGEALELVLAGAF